MNTTTIALIGLLALAGTTLLMPSALADTSYSIIADADKDTPIALAYDNAVAGAETSWTFRRINDANNDGDFLDAGETVNIINNFDNGAAATCAAATLNPEFSCQIIFNRINPSGSLVWRASSANHITGTYDLIVRYDDALESVQTMVKATIRLVPAAALALDVQGANNNLNLTLLRHDDNFTQIHRVTGWADRDTHIFSNGHGGNTAGGTNTPGVKISLLLDRLSDSNADGAYEKTNVASLSHTTGTDCGSLSSQFVCEIRFAEQSINLTWKKSDPAHTAGNYTLIIDFENGPSGNSILRRSVWAINLMENGADLADLTRTEVNVTAQHFAQNANTTTIEHVYGLLAQDLDFPTLRSIGTLAPASTGFTLTLFKLEDADANGVHERTSILSASDQTSCGGAALNGHLACNIDLANARADITWRGNSSLLEMGNFTLDFSWRSSGASVQNYTVMAQIGASSGGMTTTTTNIITNPADPVSNEASRFILFIGVLTLCGVLSTMGKKHWVLPMLGMFLSVAIAMINMSNEFFTTNGLKLFFILMPLPLMFLSGWNAMMAWIREGDERRRGEDPDGLAMEP